MPLQCWGFVEPTRSHHSLNLCITVITCHVVIDLGSIDPAKEFFWTFWSQIDMFQELSDGSCLRSLVIEGARSSVDAAFCGFLTAGAETLDLPSEQDHQNHQRYQSPSLVVLIAYNIAATTMNCRTLFGWLSTSLQSDLAGVWMNLPADLPSQLRITYN